MRRLVLALAFLCLSVPAYAQAASTLSYDIAGAVPSVVATYTQAITVDNVVQTAAPVCAPKGTTDTTCTVTMNAPLGSGTHTVTVAETLNGQTAALTVSGLNPNNAPKSAVNTRIVTTTTIVVP